VFRIRECVGFCPVIEDDSVVAVKTYVKCGKVNKVNTSADTKSDI